MSPKKKTSSKSSGAHERQIHAYTIGLTQPKADVVSILGHLKSEPVRLINGVLRRTLKLPRVRSVVFGTYKPRSFQDLLSTQLMLPLASFSEELKWTSAVMHCFPEDLSRFVRMRNEFEAEFLNGNLALAATVLGRIQEECGHSLWLLQAQLLVAQAKGGINANREILVDVFNQANSAYLRILAYFYSMKVEDNLSSATLDARIEQYFAGFEFAEDLSGTLYYLQFRSHPHFFTEYSQENLAAVLAIDTIAPIVDRYLALMHVIMIATATEGDVFNRGAVAIAIDNLLDAGIRDQQIAVVASLVSRRKQKPQVVTHEAVMQALDEYTLGNYERAISSASAALITNPEIPVLYEIWARASLYRNEIPEIPRVSSKVVAELIAAIRDALLQGPQSSQALQSILTFSYKLACIPVSASILAFYLQHNRPSHQLNGARLSYLTSSYATPRAALLFSDTSAAKDFLLVLIEQMPTSATSLLFEEILDRVIEKSTENLSARLPPDRALKYQALVLELIDKPDAAREIYKKLAASPNAPLMQINDARRGIYRSEYRLNNLDECISLAVDAGIANSTLFSPDEIAALLKSAMSVTNLRSKKDPAMPILYWMAARHQLLPIANQEIYAAYDDFLSAWNVARPSNLIALLGEFDSRRIIFFLKEVCASDVMDFSINFESTDALNN